MRPAFPENVPPQMKVTLLPWHIYAPDGFLLLEFYPCHILTNGLHVIARACAASLHMSSVPGEVIAGINPIVAK